MLRRLKYADWTECNGVEFSCACLGRQQLVNRCSVSMYVLIEDETIKVYGRCSSFGSATRNQTEKHFHLPDTYLFVATAVEALFSLL